ncbi:MAG: T9SS type A sorting domain-containing protein, partial [Bacteroidia bacterium]
SISPNPAKDYLIINLEGFDPDNYREQDLTITDVEGKKVYETKHLTSNLRLPVSNLSKGIYFVELSLPSGEGKGGAKAVKKFVKE